MFLNYVMKKQLDYDNPILFEIENLNNFIVAESEHQKYLITNPNGYCNINMNLIKKEERK